MYFRGTDENSFAVIKERPLVLAKGPRAKHSKTLAVFPRLMMMMMMMMISSDDGRGSDQIE
jgi:hypothetical protein